MKRQLEKLTKIFHHRHRIIPTVRATETDVQIFKNGKKAESVEWNKIKKIITYKIDLITTDEICVGFLFDKKNDSWLVISEEWEGFTEAKQMMETIFPEIPKDWLQEVMLPVFERNETTLYESS